MPKPASGRGPAAQAARALAAHRVLAILFFNPRGADDRGTRANLRGLQTPRGVVKLAAPLSRLASFRAVTGKVAVVSSPTLVVFDRTGTPTTLVGYADGAEMAQRIDDALAKEVRAHVPRVAR